MRAIQTACEPAHERLSHRRLPAIERSRHGASITSLPPRSRFSIITAIFPRETLLRIGGSPIFTRSGLRETTINGGRCARTACRKNTLPGTLRPTRSFWPGREPFPTRCAILCTTGRISSCSATSELRSCWTRNRRRRSGKQANAALAGELTAQGILQKFRVEVVCTTDDPIDDLRHHQAMAKSNLATRVFPASARTKLWRLAMLRLCRGSSTFRRLQMLISGI